MALSEDRNSILLAGHRLLDFYAKIPFYANMFSKAGFQLTSDQAIPDTLVDNLVISGNEVTVSAQFTELMEAGLDELMVSLVPTTCKVEEEQTQLMNLIGSYWRLPMLSLGFKRSLSIRVCLTVNSIIVQL